MKRLAPLLLCASLFLCACAGTQLEETTAQTPLTETTTAQTTTQATTAETTTTETTTVATETTYVEALGETKIKLSTMSEEDCRKFLAEAGVEIPEGWILLSVKMVFVALEENSDLNANYYDKPISEFEGKFRGSAKNYLDHRSKEDPKFTEMTNEQRIAFLKENDLEIPAQLHNFHLEKELCAFEENRDHNPLGSLMSYLAYFEDIRYAFKAYYGIPDDSRSPTLMGKPRLSLMSEDKCRQYLMNAGISVPKNYDNLKYLIWRHEQDVYYTGAAGSSYLQQFFNAVRETISEYYGMPQWQEK